MPETINTIPSEGMPASSASAPDVSPDTTPAVEATPPQEAQNPDVEAKATETEAQPSTEAATPEVKPADEETRFDKHPRWQEMLKERNDARNAAQEQTRQMAYLQGQLEALKKTQEQSQAQRPEARDYDGEIKVLVDKYEAGEISMAQAEAAKSAIYQARSEEYSAGVIRQYQEEERQKQQASQQSQQVDTLVQAFHKEHPDFAKAKESGALEKIKATNPLHDDMSAYFVAKLEEEREANKKAIDDAVAAARKETEEKFKAKRHAATLGSGPASAPVAGEVPPELAAPEKFGGVNSALALRLQQMRAGH